MVEDINKIYSYNLDNIKYDIDLFGVKIPKLRMKDRLGFLPTSLWQPDWTLTKQLKKIINDTASTRKLLDTNRGDRRNGVSGKASVFNPHLAIKILSAYCPIKANIYDAFAGGGTRGYIANKMGHTYSGVEIRKEEVNRLQNQIKDWNIPYYKFDIKQGDSQFNHFEEEKFDFAYTCPPYYDLEKYSELESDMSNAKTYEDFLIMLRNSIKITYDLLKDGAISVWVVGNFRNKKGELKHLNGDLVRLAKDVGFIMWDEIIWEGASKVAVTRCCKFEKNRKCVRMHEYIIILKKPMSKNEKKNKYK